MHLGDLNFKLFDWSLISRLHQHNFFNLQFMFFNFGQSGSSKPSRNLSSFFRCTCISLVQSHGPNGQNNSENVPTYIPTYIVGNYNIIMPNDAKIIDQENLIIEGFWLKDFKGIYSKKTLILFNGRTHSFPQIAKLTYVWSDWHYSVKQWLSLVPTLTSVEWILG